MSVTPQVVVRYPQGFFEEIRDDSDGTRVELRAGASTVDRPSNMSKNQQYLVRPEPLNTGERYMREHYNNGVPIPEVIDKSFCGTLKRHKFRAILLSFICAILLFILAGTVLYVLL
ncbi:hypothetical protein PENTCL1PPCAC_28871 [Pristionchus entomophagus]|uniref:Uncharacterized protein n=1 Tax=Pristionchus entomophagus TaxID=358040 RepID=A0AAV5UIA4_9BILA|nr:hypothetical protein PENTCL1PPCAC_28871 [Pristionchus entomophagus]